MKKVPVKNNPEFDAAVEELADLVTLSMEDEYHSDLEPFEAYSQKIRVHIYQHMHEFRHRFMTGYLNLLDELERKK